jgi:hypothetical protein
LLKFKKIVTSTEEEKKSDTNVAGKTVDKYINMTSQEKSANSINIRYTDNKIKILDKGGEFS